MNSDPPPAIVLVIDDEPVIRQSIATYLEDSGFRVLQAADGLTGLALFRQAPPAAILLDLRMPHLDGLEVLSTVTVEAPDIPVIVVSGAGLIQDAIAALQRGAWDFLTKPIHDLAVLEHTLRRALERSALRVENRRYREQLEDEVRKRTADLQARTVALEEANTELQREMAERHKAEQSLRRSKERLDLALEASRNGLFDLNLESGQAFYSPSFRALVGSAPEACPGRSETWDQRVHPEDRATIAHLLHAWETESPPGGQHECRMQNDGGLWRWMMVRGKIVERTGNGKPLRLIGTLADIHARKLNEEALRLSEARLQDETWRLQSSLKGSTHFGPIVGRSPAMQVIYDLILKAARTHINVIIYGESGTGKELVAQTIHRLSTRGGKPFVTVNCGAIPANLIESEFFGYRKGAFTGAEADRAGYLEAAEGGTLFLDEIGELEPNLQVKLLRTIEGGGYTALGGREVLNPDLRIVAATNRDLQKSLREGRLREDFFYRIHVLPIHLPPLRRRPADIPLLVYHFLQNVSDGTSSPPAFSEVTMAKLLEHDWPGNVRELQNVIHRYNSLRTLDLPSRPKPHLARASDEVAVPDATPTGDAILPLGAAASHFEKEYIQRALASHRWRKTRTALSLGIDRRTLLRKIRQLGIE